MPEIRISFCEGSPLMNQTDDTPFSNLAVLLVEDEAFAQKLAMGALKQIGVRSVITAKNGQEALSILELPHKKFDLVISDWNMPEMSGLELLKNVRQTWPDMPFIMLTGKTTADFILAAKDHGVNGYIAKPFAPAQLTSKIAAVLKLKLP
jgi:two-component system, chemotaxis family, chemotaxis protein CheY